MSYLAGTSPRLAVLIRPSIGEPPRLCRILRVSRPSRWLLLEFPLMSHRDYIVSYGWVAPTGGSYWNFHWWVFAIMSYLTGESPQPVVLVGTSIGAPPRLYRILRLGRPSRWLLLELPLVDNHDYVVSYGWAAPAGGSSWNFHWWATAIMSYLTGGSP